jgi:hypothetical protein
LDRYLAPLHFLWLFLHVLSLSFTSENSNNVSVRVVRGLQNQILRQTHFSKLNMVARNPLRQNLAVLDPVLIRQTLNTVDHCMNRLQELQSTVSGGTKLVSGINLSPRSTRTYLRTSLRCKQESIRYNFFFWLFSHSYFNFSITYFECYTCF